MTSSQSAKPSTAVADTIAGFTAGLVSTLVVHPLDLIKTRLQLDRSHRSGQLGSSLRTIREIAQEARHYNSKSVQAYYRGLSTNIVGNTASWSLYFLWYGQIKNWIASTKDGGRLTSTDYLLASGTAGVLTSALTNPIWVVKTRIMSSDGGATGAYRGLTHGLVQIISNEGVRGLYRGFLPSLFGVAQAAIQFMSYEKLKIWRKEQRRLTDTMITDNYDDDERMTKIKNKNFPKSIVIRQEGEDGGKVVSAESAGGQTPTVFNDGKISLLSNADFLVLSASSKIVAGLVTYPYQVVRARLQTYDAAQIYTSARHVIIQTYAIQGIPGFYKGLGPNLARVLPSTCITFLVYENTRHYFMQMQ